MWRRPSNNSISIDIIIYRKRRIYTPTKLYTCLRNACDGGGEEGWDKRKKKSPIVISMHWGNYRWNEILY